MEDCLADKKNKTSEVFDLLGVLLLSHYCHPPIIFYLP